MNVDSSHSNDKLFYNQNKPDYYGKFNHFIKMNRLPAVFRKYFTIEQIQSECPAMILWNHSKETCVPFILTDIVFSFFISDVSKRQIHITGMNFDITWRRDRRLPKNPTSTGPLTDLPDYTFMDGRPTPLGVCMHSNNKFRSDR